MVKMGTTAAQKKLFFNLRKAKSNIGAIEEGDLTPDHTVKLADQLGVTEREVTEMNRRLSGAGFPRSTRRLRSEVRKRMAGLAGRRHRRPGNPAGRTRGARRPA